MDNRDEIATLEQAAISQATYQPNQAVKNSLKNKSLIMFVGPVATGKTFVMNTVVAENSAFGRVPAFTTREPRNDDDNGMFRYFPHDDHHITRLLNKIKLGEAVQYAIHPTSQRIYGSEVQDYPNEYNMLATLSGVVGQMSTLPFRHTFIIGLVCKADVWQAWLSKRYPHGGQEMNKRVMEAIRSLEWLLEHTVVWVENVPNQPQQTARAVIDAVLYNKKNDNARIFADDMLRQAREMLQ